MKILFLAFRIFCVLVIVQKSYTQAETEPNDHPYLANLTFPGQTATGSLNTSSGVNDYDDWWKIIITETGLLELTLTAKLDEFPSFGIQMYHSGDTTRILVFGYLPDPVLKFPVMPGTYLFHIGSNNGNGKYSFVTKLTPPLFSPDEEPNNHALTARNIAGSPFTGALRYYMDPSGYDEADWFNVNTTQSDLTLFIEKNEIDFLYIDVFNASDTTTPILKSNMTNLDTQTIHITNGSGNYKIKMSSSAHYGSYRIFASGLTNINSTSGTEQIQVYPNPSIDIYHIEFPSPSADIKILNLTGQTILETRLSDKNSKLDLAGYPASNYLLLMKSEREAIFKHIIIKL